MGACHTYLLRYLAAVTMEQRPAGHMVRGKEAQHPPQAQRGGGEGKFQSRVVADSSEKKPKEKLGTWEA